MKNLLLVIIFFAAVNVSAQNKYDTKIIIKVNDTANAYLLTKYALANTDFVVRDNGRTDTVTTLSRDLRKIPGYMSIKAAITESTIELTGIYGLKMIDDFGYTRNSNDTNRVLYYKASKTWRIMKEVAEKIGGEISYSK